ncbi:hypothetical protein H6A60_08015 [Sutterella massiliensis]|uniref:DUF1640 domain-containing protein n=1 Tax=Sutterella massiliensis TaxID=1816689 RepID=A0ABS2DUP7_9BURK|nr:hypothetical protein [Sutterella massiliensis]MBM6704423.1 hypothetical protein [Sutterella massiliensis]
MLDALIAAIKSALLDAVKEKAEEMTKEEAKAWLEKLGVKVSEITDEMLANIDAAKSQMDTETRRKVRAVWAAISAVTFAIGVGIGLLL